MSHIKNIFSTILVFASLSIAVTIYSSNRPLVVRSVDGFVLSIKPMSSFKSRCYEITLAVKGIKKPNWEPGEERAITPNSSRFSVCEKQEWRIEIARKAMAETKKVTIVYIDDYYDLEKKLFDTRFTISTIKIEN